MTSGAEGNEEIGALCIKDSDPELAANPMIRCLCPRCYPHSFAKLQAEMLEQGNGESATMQTPTITRVSLEPFCPACGGPLHMREYDEILEVTIQSEQDGDPLRYTEVLMLICPWCGKALRALDVVWREREKEEE